MNLKDYFPFDLYIEKADLEIGAKYFCKARNFKIGLWNGTSFEYNRVKFGSTFKDDEYHWDDGAPFGTVKPFCKLGYI